jgi:ABC-type lipoprotein export system ATPase subunit
MVTHDPALAARARRKLHVLDGRLIDPNAAGQPAALPHAAAPKPAAS